MKLCIVRPSYRAKPEPEHWHEVAGVAPRSYRTRCGERISRTTVTKPLVARYWVGCSECRKAARKARAA